MSEQEKHNDFKSLCAGYVLGALTDDEQKQFKQMLEDATEEERQIYEDMKAAKDELALATEPVSPSADVERRIFESIESTDQYEDGQSDANIIPMWVYKAAAAVLLIGFLGLSYYTSNLSGTIEQQEAQITQLKSELEQQDELLSVLAAKEVRLVKMGGLEPSPEGYGKIVWDPEKRQAILQLANLPAPPEGKDYQLWLIKGNQNPISAGVFNFEQPSSDLFFKVEQLNESPSPQENTFAVTLEPEGGVPQPTGDMFLVGKQS
ncbi:anti-sigma factor [Fodinibius sp. Rm-B-1B1-1]|uniref:anti-sigma factor n=1 Tax=Fodinibius alkaliphilus TaxID=3140241 RepID=UPI00315A848D